MKKFFSLLFAFSFSLVNAVGFEANTLVTTESGRLIPIKDLGIGDHVVCYNKNFERVYSPVKGISALTVDSTIHITTEDNVDIIVSGLERFFLPKEGAWVGAKYLKEGDCLLNDDLETVAIINIEQSNEPLELYTITVEKLHNFLASEGQYLAHNGPWAAIQAYWAVKAALYGGIGLTVTGAVLVSGGTVTAATALYSAGATTTAVITGTSAGMAGSVIAGAAVPTAATSIGVAGAASLGTVVGGAELGAIAAASATGASAIVTTSAATVASIEAAALTAFSAAMACWWLP